MADQGRPSTFDRAIADQILARVSNGETLRQVCRSEGMPPESTVRNWAVYDYDGFAAQYARARDAQMEAWADETIDIADDARNDWIERENARTGATFIALNEEAISRARLRVDQRKWLMSKWKPSTYGDKITAEHTGKDGGPIQTETAATIDVTGLNADQLRALASIKVPTG